MASSQLFEGKSDHYRQGRTGYSPEILSVLKELFVNNAAAADIGCGTGIFSRLLLETGFKVYGVESNAAMLSAAADALACDAFVPVLGSAESIPLPDSSVDLICAAQSFHWFDRAVFRRECDRLLKSNGHILLVWNTKDLNSELMQEYQAVCRCICAEKFSGFHNGLDLYGSEIKEFFNGSHKFFSYSNPTVCSREKFLSWCFSSSYSPKKEDKNYPAFLLECEKLFERFSVDNSIILPSQTIVYVGK